MDSIGITGTRKGMTNLQAATHRALLLALGPEWMHNGLAPGVDAESAVMAQELGVRVWGHPSTHGSHRAAWSICERLEPPLPPLRRNKVIVDMGKVLVACPATFKEVLRSGTWATVRHARKAGKTVFFCWPDGTLTQECHDHV